MLIKKISKTTTGEVISKTSDTCPVVVKQLKESLLASGFNANVRMLDKESSCTIDVSEVRLSKEYTDVNGKNINMSTGKRASVLGWDDWVRVNNTINNVLDFEGIKAEVVSKTLVGKPLIVRDLDGRKREDDWDEIGDTPILNGMMVYRDLWVNEKKAGKFKEM